MSIRKDNELVAAGRTAFEIENIGSEPGEAKVDFVDHSHRAELAHRQDRRAGSTSPMLDVLDDALPTRAWRDGDRRSVAEPVSDRVARAVERDKPRRAERATDDVPDGRVTRRLGKALARREKCFGRDEAAQTTRPCSRRPAQEDPCASPDGELEAAGGARDWAANFYLVAEIAFDRLLNPERPDGLVPVNLPLDGLTDKCRGRSLEQLERLRYSAAAREGRVWES